MITTYEEDYEALFAESGAMLRVAAVGLLASGIFWDEGGNMTLQDDLRAEQTEVADTGSLLLAAADQLDVLEAQVAAGNPVRIAQLEAAIAEIQAIINAL